MKLFPVAWIVEGRCSCGKPDCPSPGKHPLVAHGVSDASDDPEILNEWRERWPDANWALATGDLVVIDLDRKNGVNGLASFKELAQGRTVNTRTIRTGGGGLHLYFLSPDFRVSNSASKLGPGIDVRGHGGYVLIPPSNHLSGARYEVLRDLEVAPLPEWLADLLRPSADLPSAPAAKVDFGPASPEVLQAARDALETYGPAIQGQGGDARTYVVCAMLTHDFGLKEDEAWPLLAEWNQTCQPPWSEDALAQKLTSGEKYAKGAYGAKRPVDLVQLGTSWIREWQESGEHTNAVQALTQRIRDLITVRRVDPTVRAVLERELKAATRLGTKALALPPAFVRKEIKPASQEQWLHVSATGGVVANHSNIVHHLERIKAPIWGDTFLRSVMTENRAWTDGDTGALVLKLQREESFPATVQLTHDAVNIYAHEYQRDSLAEYLEALQWDGVRRVETFFQRALGADDTPYVRGVSVNFLRSLVVRGLGGFEGNNKVDTMVVLEGPQGIGKSSSLRALVGPERYSSVSVGVSPTDKDFYDGLRGKWLVEVAELDAFNRVDPAAVKAMLSTETDHYRVSYGKTAQDFKRRSVFAGSTNETEWARDPTGGRRYWPITCTRADLGWITENNEQLFAEALVDVKAGATWWHLPEGTAEAEIEARSVPSDPWEDVIRTWIAAESPEYVTSEGLLTNQIGKTTAQQTRADKMRVGAVLKHLGLIRRQTMIAGARLWRWYLK